MAPTPRCVVVEGCLLRFPGGSLARLAALGGGVGPTLTLVLALLLLSTAVVDVVLLLLRLLRLLFDRSREGVGCVGPTMLCSGFGSLGSRREDVFWDGCESVLVVDVAGCCARRIDSSRVRRLVYYGDGPVSMARKTILRTRRREEQHSLLLPAPAPSPDISLPQ